ncbi:response regulator [Marivita sp.]|uniref:response regulator n=1 Tax=Marivita sp. TaxID=2003365 RepID=UPI0025BBC343|nr:response regulator [Marivita sp.]
MNHDMRATLSGKRVLVVDDEWLIALDVQDIIEGLGCSVMGPVASASAALELISTDPPDCAVLDVHILNGTSEPIAAALQKRGCPFVVVTAYQRSHLTGALCDAPMLIKPIDERELERTLAGLVR